MGLVVGDGTSAAPADCSVVRSAWVWLTPGNLHFPAAFCGQITFGSTSETSLITSRRENSDQSRTCNTKLFASRKLAAPRSDVCGIVIPLSFRPAQGVTLMRPMCNTVPRRWRSSCWILSCVPCDCTYKFSPSRAIAAKIDSPPRTNRMIRPNFCTWNVTQTEFEEKIKAHWPS